MVSRILIALATLALLACQPVPRPFAERPAQEAALLALPDRGGVVVATVASVPRPVGEALANAVVAALRLQNIPAMHGTAGNRESFTLDGRVEETAESSRLVWDLRDPTGASLGGPSVPLDGVRVVRGADKLTLYQWGTMTAKHYFCSVCGIYTHHQRRSNPNEYGVNAAALEGINPRDLGAVPWDDGVNHPCDRKN